MDKLKSLLMLDDKKFYKMLIFLAIPICLQNLITSSVNMIDTLMVGSLGETEIAAVGVSNQIFFLFNFILIGITGGCGIYIAQFFGSRNIKGVGNAVTLATLLALVVAGIFMTAGILIPEYIIGIFNSDPELISKGRDYFSIVCIGYLFTAITISFSTASKNIGNTITPMVVSFIALLINAGLNYILIFGKFGFEPLGIKGAAIGTVIARLCEAVILVSYLCYKKSIVIPKKGQIFASSGDFYSRILKTVLDTTLIEIAWAAGVVMYSVAYGKIGKEALASIQIFTTVQNFFLIIVYGISNSAAVMIAQKIGENKNETAAKYGRGFTWIGTVVGVILAVLMIITAKPVVSMFNISDSLAHDTVYLLWIGAISFAGFVVNTILIVGIFRGGGDTKYPLAIESFTIWCIGVPLAFLGAIYFKLPVYVVVLLVGIEEAVKTIFTIKRLRSDKWVKNVVKEVCL
ncbi:MAG: MATE family efflux transporter [Clostridium sp.]